MHYDLKKTNHKKILERDPTDKNILQEECTS